MRARNLLFWGENDHAAASWKQRAKSMQCSWNSPIKPFHSCMWAVISQLSFQRAILAIQTKQQMSRAVRQMVQRS